MRRDFESAQGKDPTNSKHFCKNCGLSNGFPLALNIYIISPAFEHGFEQARILPCSKTAPLTIRDANNNEHGLFEVRWELSLSLMPNRVIGIGCKVKVEDCGKKLETSYYYFPRLGHVQYIWIRVASSLLHLLQQGLTSGQVQESFSLDMSLDMLDMLDVELTCFITESHSLSHLNWCPHPDWSDPTHLPHKAGVFNLF